jgi:preprotein translocase subunit SecD
MLQLLAQTKFFSSGNPWSGLDPTALGAVYRGRAEFRTPVAAGKKAVASQREAQKRQTIAERKAGVGVGARSDESVAVSDESKES